MAGLLNAGIDPTVAPAQTVGTADLIPLKTMAPQEDWPSPVNDQAPHLFTLVDVLEYRPSTGAGQHRVAELVARAVGVGGERGAVDGDANAAAGKRGARH